MLIETVYLFIYFTNGGAVSNWIIYLSTDLNFLNKELINILVVPFNK